MSGWVSPALEPEEHEKLLAIESGIRAYMRPQVVDWLMNRSSRNGGYMDEDVANFLSLAFKMKFPTYLGDYEALLKQLSDPLLVSVVDWFLYHDVNSSQQLAKEIGSSSTLATAYGSFPMNAPESLNLQPQEMKDLSRYG